MFFSNLTAAAIPWVISVAYVVLLGSLLLLAGVMWKRTNRPSFKKRAAFGIPLTIAAIVMMIVALVNIDLPFNETTTRGQM